MSITTSIDCKSGRKCWLQFDSKAIVANIVNRNSSGPFTNLDDVKGTVIVNLKSSESLKSIEVKLEGISYCVVQVKMDKQYDCIEQHKFLFQNQTVFPPKDIRSTSSSHNYTLPEGCHKFDFAFQIPSVTDCDSIQQPKPKVYPAHVVHKVTNLPPSIVAGKWSIKYYLKVTINRGSFLRTNIRSYFPLEFLPTVSRSSLPDKKYILIERSIGLPIRDDSEENVSSVEQQSGGLSSIKSFFESSLSPRRSPNRTITANFHLEARVPAIIIPSESIRVKLFISFPFNPILLERNTIFLDQLIVNLFAITTACAHIHEEEDIGTFGLFSRSNLMIPIPVNNATRRLAEKEGGGTEEVWDVKLNPSIISLKIPSTIIPSFKMCNLSREYKLQLKAGFRSNSFPGDLYEAGLESDVTLATNIIDTERSNHSSEKSPSYSPTSSLEDQSSPLYTEPEFLPYYPDIAQETHDTSMN